MKRLNQLNRRARLQNKFHATRTLSRAKRSLQEYNGSLRSLEDVRTVPNFGPNITAAVATCFTDAVEAQPQKENRASPTSQTSAVVCEAAPRAEGGPAQGQASYKPRNRSTQWALLYGVKRWVEVPHRSHTWIFKREDIVQAIPPCCCRKYEAGTIWVMALKTLTQRGIVSFYGANEYRLTEDGVAVVKDLDLSVLSVLEKEYRDEQAEIAAAQFEAASFTSASSVSSGDSMDTSEDASFSVGASVFREPALPDMNRLSLSRTPQRDPPEQRSVSARVTPWSAAVDMAIHSLQQDEEPQQSAYQHRTVFERSPLLSQAKKKKSKGQRRNKTALDDSSPPPKLEVVLVVDSRERQARSESNLHAHRQVHRGPVTSYTGTNLTSFLDQFQIRYETKNLPVGDMLWMMRCKKRTPRGKAIVEDYVLGYIVERKTVSDLCSSISDGRYAEQKHRMASRCQDYRVSYLLEGDPSSPFNAGSAYRASNNYCPKTVIKSLCSTQVLNNFQVHYALDLEDTARYISNVTTYIANKLRIAEPDQARLVYNKLVEEKSTFPEFQALTGKSSNLTVGDLFAKQILSIRGCSEGKAYAIVSLYPTARHLCRAYFALSSAQEKERLLSKLRTPTGIAVGAAISKAVWQMFAE